MIIWKEKDKLDILWVTIIGLGMIGGSLGLALKEAFGDDICIIGVDKDDASLSAAKERGAADLITSRLDLGVAEADLIFMCVPMLQMLPIIEKIVPNLKPGVILSDVGSTKGYLIENIFNLLPPEVRFVPGHPMAGRENSGIWAADRALFQDKWYIIATYDGLEEEAAHTVKKIVEKIGAKVTFMDIADHDRHTAVISHLPHVAAAAMVNLLSHSQDIDNSLKLAGGGFRDTTRIASSNADMWADILMTNREAITDSLEKFKKILDGIILAIGRGERQELYDFFAAAKLRRDKLLLLENKADNDTSSKQ